MKALMFALTILAFATSANAQQKPDDGIDDEKAVKVFSYLLDGETAARIHLADMRRIAAATPYKPLVIVGVSHQLLVWGWNPGEAKDIVKACANAGAGVGADDERYAKIALFVGRLTDAEESTHAALSNLEGQGVPAWRIAGRMIGKSVEETKSLALQRRLKPRILAQALVAGFNEMYEGAAERETKRTKTEASSASNAPATAPPPPPPNAQSGYRAEVIRARVVPFRTAQGRDEQMLLVDWKNTGTLLIGQVKATMIFFDESGRQLDQVKDYNIFVTYNEEKTIKPGKTYIEPEGEGFVVIAMPPLYHRAARADVVLTKVAGIPTM